MKRLALCIGHGPAIDKGAENRDGTTELAWNTGLAYAIKTAIGNRLHCVIVRREEERVPPIQQVNALVADFCVELHLNSFDGRATGAEMIVHPGSAKGRELAELLLGAAVGVLDLPNRGVKGPQAGGRGAAFLSKTRCPAVIVESFFIDNDRDLQRGNERKAQLAEAYAEAFAHFAQ